MLAWIIHSGVTEERVSQVANCVKSSMFNVDGTACLFEL